MFKNPYSIPLIYAILLPLSFVAGLVEPGIKQSLALYPRDPAYLSGIVSTVFVHKDLNHISSNCLTLFICLFGLYYFYRQIATKVLVISHVLTGFLIWIFARSAFHIGASGLVYALVLFILISGVIRKNRRLRIFALMVLVFQSGLIWGVFPMDNEVSWESHLIGAIIGIVQAIMFRHQGPEEDKPIDWGDELEPEQDEYSQL